ncbi:hypothetical protein LDENG_00187370 [Lucifuga dentata]|nr:hypothetical protein LDENG_00187370 [Lucifuga dentata]
MGVFFTRREGLFCLKLHAAHCFCFYFLTLLFLLFVPALLFWLFSPDFLFIPLFIVFSLQDCSHPSLHHVAASRLFFSPFFTVLLKLRLVVLYFKVISSNFISCSKKFLPESAIDVITTST